tara:strand:+ start:196 stop:363 length:168 start_codon:yes stop_codon:yes gene_type:complete
MNNKNNYKIPEEDRTRIVHTKKIKCDLDHPVVFYTIGSSGFVVCGYCNMKYVGVE